MTEFLHNITGPESLKRLSVNQLPTLAEETRDFILASVGKTGGHLASNLGVVELTIALHYVFDFQTDKLLWDVGHQCYTHKILTGRKDRFHLLRKENGISGFPNPDESPYDQFAVGHAGTSIATAVGMAMAQQMRDTDNKIVALVGDASIVNGVSFEALNNLGLVKRQMLIVLNDNSMAIDPTQGAVAKYFSKIRLSHTYEDFVKTTSNILEHVPGIGKSVEDAIEKIKKHIRMALPASQMFESLNIPYFGPVDGHDITSLVPIFLALEKLQHPAILHVYTKKGKGINPDHQPARYHSTGPYQLNGDTIETQEGPTRKTYTDHFGQTIAALAKKDSTVVAITSAMCEGTGLSEFREKFPDRFFDVGIAESAAVDIAAGLAKSGFKPVICIYSTFLQRCFDQIFQEVSLQNLPIVFCVDRAGLVGPDGPTHHGMMDIGFLRMMPNIILAAPAHENEIKPALQFALNSTQSVVLRYPKSPLPSLPGLEDAFAKPFELARSVILEQNPRSRIALVGYGDVFGQILTAAANLKKQNIPTDIVNARFAKPIDPAILDLAAAGKTIFTVEDHSLTCGFASALLEAAAQRDCALTSKIHPIAAPDAFIGPAKRNRQFIHARLNAENIENAVKKTLAQNLLQA